MSCFLQAVLGLEQLLEDGVVERLRAQQADVEHDRLGRPCRPCGDHITGGTDDWQLMPTRASFEKPALVRLVEGQRVGRVRVAAAGRRRGPLPCWWPRPGMAFQVAAVALEVRRRARRRCSPCRCAQISMRRHEPAVLAHLVDHVVAGPGRGGCPGRCRRPRRLARTRAKRCSSASGSHVRKRGQARVQVVQPFWPWMQSSGRARPRGGTACSRPARGRSR